MLVQECERRADPRGDERSHRRIEREVEAALTEKRIGAEQMLEREQDVLPAPAGNQKRHAEAVAHVSHRDPDRPPAGVDDRQGPRRQRGQPIPRDPVERVLPADHFGQHGRVVDGGGRL